HEPLGPDSGGNILPEDLERDEPLVFDVSGEVHSGHAAATELALDHVEIADRLRQRVKIRSHPPPMVRPRSRGSAKLVFCHELRSRADRLCYRRDDPARSPAITRVLAWLCTTA